MQKVKVSIILVHFRAKKELFACLDSIVRKTKLSYEVIVVDNDVVKKIKTELLRRFPQVNYLPSPKNLGYGAGNNLGARAAKGEYLFILNPDSLVFANTVKALLAFLARNPKAAIAAPILLDKNFSRYPIQATGRLNPLAGIIGLSFLNKLFPGNIISRGYWQRDKKFTKPTRVGVISGSAFMIRKKVFEKLRGFDENFFLYFEETDLCKRAEDAGFSSWVVPFASVVHFWGASTPKTKRIKKIFNRSRFYYFRKHYGLPVAVLVQLVCSFSKWHALLILLTLTAFLFIRG